MRTTIIELQLETLHVEREIHPENRLRRLLGSDWTERDVLRPRFRTRIARMFRNPHGTQLPAEDGEEHAMGA